MFGDFAVLNDIEQGIPAKPATFALVTTLALCPVIEPGNDQVRLWTVHLARVAIANTYRMRIGIFVCSAHAGRRG